MIANEKFVFQRRVELVTEWKYIVNSDRLRPKFTERINVSNDINREPTILSVRIGRTTLCPVDRLFLRNFSHHEKVYTGYRIYVQCHLNDFNIECKFH